MNKIFKEIYKERERQDKKWGEQNHKPIEWIAILTEEVGEASKEALELNFGSYSDKKEKELKYRNELIEVAAVCVAMIQCLERNQKDNLTSLGLKREPGNDVVTGTLDSATMKDLQDDDEARDGRVMFDRICNSCHKLFKSTEPDMEICPSCYM